MIDSWEDFYQAVKRMRLLQKDPCCLGSERRCAEREIDTAIAERDGRNESLCHPPLFSKEVQS